MQSNNSADAQPLEFRQVEVNEQAVAKLKELSDRDKELAKFAVSNGLEIRIAQLEKDNAYLKARADAYIFWRESNTFLISRFITKLFGPINSLRKSGRRIFK